MSEGGAYTDPKQTRGEDSSKDPDPAKPEPASDEVAKNRARDPLVGAEKVKHEAGEDA
jgi:hypothetical protein